MTYLANVQLSNERDIFNQGLHNLGHFSVRSMYAYMTNQGTLFTNKFIWKLKLPLKIKIFLWYRQRGVILTKDNLAKRNQTTSQKYCFCDHNATIKHLFLLLPCENYLEYCSYCYWVNPTQIYYSHAWRLAHGHGEGG